MEGEAEKGEGGGGLCFSTGGLNVTGARAVMKKTSVFMTTHSGDGVCFWHPGEKLVV